MKRLISIGITILVVLSSTNFTGTHAMKTAMSFGNNTIAAGSGHSLAIKEDGSLWAWGNNVCGQLGDGTVTVVNEAMPWIIIEDNNKSIPMKIMDDVVSVAAGGAHTLAIKSDGSLWAFGWNRYGQLGDGTAINRSKPVKIMDGVAAISVGAFHSLILKEDGSLCAFGNNTYGQLGDGTVTTYENDFYHYYLNAGFDVKVKENNDKNRPVKIMDDVVAISAGSIHNLAIKSDGSLWSWGDNKHGQLGDGTVSVYNINDPVTWLDNNKSAPVRIMEDVALISAGDSHNLAVKTDGSLWAWGDNRFGKLGDGTGRHFNYFCNDDKFSPQKIMDDVVYASAGGEQSLAVRTDGNLWAWGDYARPTQYNNTSKVYNTPIRIINDVASVSAGGWHNLAIKTNGSLWSWGANLSGVLGDGKDTVWHYDVLIEENDREKPEKIMDDVKLPKDTTGVIFPPTDLIRVTLNGNLLFLDQPPIIENGRTLVPLRAIFEALGAMVFWDQSTQTVTAYASDTIKLTIGSDAMFKNNEQIKLDVPAKIIGGKTMVPVRAVAEALGAEVEWDGKTQTVIITD
jgi:alpha-tubulin suppressor-like RCC1 family protein